LMRLQTGGIYYMLIDLKVCMMKIDSTRKAAILADIKELLNSKDFKVFIYTTKLTLQQSFIKENSNIFKVPLALFEDVQLSGIFATIVSDLLSSIRGNMKSKLLSSIRKRMSIMDTAKSLAHGCIEVDAAHWNRLAFLALYSPSLISSLHSAVRARIGPKLGIDIDSIEREMYGDETDGMDENSGGNGDVDQDYDPEDNEGVDTPALNGRPLHPDDSGFGDNGKPIVFSAGKFWNFVNISLENVRKIAKEEAAGANQGGRTGYETAFRQ
ncbi:hypothetical protein M405DRAFT_749060, partial [Rhizopogon salebrosus TDB-379]